MPTHQPSDGLDSYRPGSSSDDFQPILGYQIDPERFRPGNLGSRLPVIRLTGKPRVRKLIPPEEDGPDPSLIEMGGQYGHVSLRELTEAGFTIIRPLVESGEPYEHDEAAEWLLSSGNSRYNELSRELRHVDRKLIEHGAREEFCPESREIVERLEEVRERIISKRAAISV